MWLIQIIKVVKWKQYKMVLNEIKYITLICYVLLVRRDLFGQYANIKLVD